LGFLIWDVELLIQGGHPPREPSPRMLPWCVLPPPLVLRRTPWRRQRRQRRRIRLVLPQTWLLTQLRAQPVTQRTAALARPPPSGLRTATQRAERRKMAPPTERLGHPPAPFRPAICLQSSSRRDLDLRRRLPPPQRAPPLPPPPAAPAAPYSAPPQPQRRSDVQPENTSC